MPTVATDELRELYELHADRIHTLARYMLGSPSAADDAVQSVFLKAFEHRERFRGQAAAATWLWRIAVNHCHDELRRRRRADEVPLEAILGWADAGQSPEVRQHLKQLDGVVARAVLQLSPKLRAVVVLRYVQDLSYDEIAAVLGCSVGTVSSRLARALTALEKILRLIIRS